MIKVKLSIPGFGNNLNLSQYLGNKENILGDCKFYVNKPDIEDVDFWFILDDLQLPIERVKVPTSNVFFLRPAHHPSHAPHKQRTPQRHKKRRRVQHNKAQCLRVT
jgi:hypothetical protein